MGRVTAVCLGPGGVPKHPVERAEVQAHGLAGDAHRYDFHGGANRAVCLLSRAEVRDLEREGVRPLAPGDFGENLLVDGLDLRELRPGDHLAIGADVVLELTDVRSPCATLKAIDARLPDLMLGRSGYLARVHQGGAVAPGDAVRALSPAERDALHERA